MLYFVERKNDKMRQNITHLESVSIIIVLPYHTGTDQATYKYSVQVTLKRKGTWRMVHTGRVATGLHILSSTEYSVLGKPFIRNRQRQKKKRKESMTTLALEVRNCPSPIHRPRWENKRPDSSEAPRLVADWIPLCHIRKRMFEIHRAWGPLSVAQKGTSVYPLQTMVQLHTSTA